MTLHNWAYSILNIVNPLLMDDEEVTIDQVKDWIIEYRATFLENKLNSGKKATYQISQTIPNLELEFIQTNEEHIKIFKTVKIIPSIIGLKNSNAILRIGSNDVTTPGYKYTENIKEVAFLGNGRFNTNNIFVYLQNDFIYVKTKDPIFPITINNSLSIDAVFADPRDVGKYNTTNNLLYSDKFTDFPTDLEMKRYIDNAILQERFNITERSNPDKINDGQDNTPQNVKR